MTVNSYSSNSKAYRVFNNATRMIEETCDMEFDETNGSQWEEFSCDGVGDEPLREVMKNIAIGKSSQRRKSRSYQVHPLKLKPLPRMTPRLKRRVHHRITIMSHPMKKMALHILLMTPKMNKWLKNNFHLMTHTSQVNKPKLKPKMSNY